ncbi:hypothetical protein QJQ45_024649 [Haematococcus lacustris]|nr:hypothetical protein QJQ45_024649 [Haematococcus lacustris]
MSPGSSSSKLAPGRTGPCILYDGEHIASNSGTHFDYGKKDQKFISREEEPDQYWVSKSEKAGANPFKDPLALIGILAIFFPFIFVLIAIGVGAIDVSVYR